MTLKTFQEQVAMLNEHAQHGCRNHGCQIEQPKGMATNGSCQCSPQRFSRMLLELASETDNKYHWDK